MKVHHLNGATLCPFAGETMVSHLLLVESETGLILVDTGLGLTDCRDPRVRLGRFVRALIRPVLDPEETAYRQIERLGFAPADVRHIVITHLDVDHAGGLADFPQARIHLMAAEQAAAQTPGNWFKTHRYRGGHWSHGPQWVPYQPVGETWFGFDNVQALVGVSEDVLLVPLPGHSPGHLGVAVRQKTGWLFHAGDSYYHHRQIEDDRAPLYVRFFQRLAATDNAERIACLARVRKLAKQEQFQVFCAHDAHEFSRLSAR